MVHFSVAMTRANMNRCGGAPGISDGVLTGKCVSEECHRWGMCSFRLFFEEEAREEANCRGERMVRAEAFSAEKSAVLWRSGKVSCCTFKCLMNTGTCRVGQAKDLVSDERAQKVVKV